MRASESAVAQSEGMYWRYESFIKKQESKIHSTVSVVGEINAIRREYFAPIPENTINDDAYLAHTIMRKGARIIYEPDAYSWETPSQSTRDDVVRRRRINAGRYQLFFQPLRLYPWNNPLVLFMLFSHKYSRLLLPMFMGGAFIANTLTIALDPSNELAWLTWVGQALFYGLAVLGLWADRRNIKSMKLAKLAFFIVNSNIAAFEGLVEYLRGRQSVMWEKG